jgi:hypothetical protein
VTRLGIRITRVEQRIRPATEQEVRILWPTQLKPCIKHPECDIEIETGEHHRNVIHLSFEN